MRPQVHLHTHTHASSHPFIEQAAIIQSLSFLRYSKDVPIIDRRDKRTDRQTDRDADQPTHYVRRHIHQAVRQSVNGILTYVRM